MRKETITLKIEKDTHKKFKKLKNLKEFELEESITFSNLLEILLEGAFKKYDGKTIEPRE